MTGSKKHAWVAFVLTMPGRGSWDGRWSGDDVVFAKCKMLTQGKIDELLKGKSEVNFSYRWDDGWRANIEVFHVTAQDKVKLMRKSCGFSSYDWMIDSIIEYGDILTADERRERFEQCVVL